MLCLLDLQASTTANVCTVFQVEDTRALGIYEPLSVKLQVYKTAIETAILLLRIDDIVSGSKKRDESSAPAGGPTQESMAE